MIPQIKVKDLKTKMDNKEDFLLIDVRRPDEIQIAAISGTTNIEMNSIPDSIDELDKNKETIVMCRSGMRSMQVSLFLESQGFTNVLNLEGGILAWADQIDPSLQTY